MFPRGLRASCFGNTDAVLFIPSEGNQVTYNSSPSTPGPAGCVERDPKKQDSEKKEKKKKEEVLMVSGPAFHGTTPRVHSEKKPVRSK